MKVDLKTVLAVIGLSVTMGGVLFGVGRYVGAIEARISVLEAQSEYVHGRIDLPEGTK